MLNRNKYEQIAESKIRSQLLLFQTKPLTISGMDGRLYRHTGRKIESQKSNQPQSNNQKLSLNIKSFSIKSDEMRGDFNQDNIQKQQNYNNDDQFIKLNNTYMQIKNLSQNVLEKKDVLIDYQKELMSRHKLNPLYKDAFQSAENKVRKLYSYENSQNLPSQVFGFSQPEKVQKLIKIDPTGQRISKFTFCNPNCQHNHRHDYGFNYNKSFKDPLEERPGQQSKNLTASDFKQFEEKGVCNFGLTQSPINLDTQIEILEDFQDKEFDFKYKKLEVPKEIEKFNEQRDQFYFDMSHNSFIGDGENVMQTQTINLFDKHIQKAKFDGWQFHFHSPSEHSIDGKILDLEMHIVHFTEDKHNKNKQKEQNNQNQASQFTNAVIGLLFKVVPDSEFDNKKLSNYHDLLLQNLVSQQKQNSDFEFDLQNFLKNLNYNRRWTYQGSLTTKPFAEGILWNVVEQIIPIRQSTLDMFNEYKDIDQYTKSNRFETEQQKNDRDETKCEEQNECAPIWDDITQKTFFRTAVCSRPVQDIGSRPVFHIDINQQ